MHTHSQAVRRSCLTFRHGIQFISGLIVKVINRNSLKQFHIGDENNIRTMEHKKGVNIIAPNNHREGLENSKIARWCVYALFAFPLTDYALRLPHIHPIGVIWDKVVMIALATIALWRWISGYRPKRFLWQKYAIWYMLYGLTLVFAGMSHPIIALEGFRTDVYYMLYTFLLPFVVSPKDTLKLLHVSASVAILIGVHGVYQYITKAPMDPSWADVGEHLRTRVYSVLTSPNELGAYMALMVPIILGLFLYERYKWRKWFYGIGALICFATQLFTFDRGSLLALVLAVFILAIVFKRRLLIFLVAFAVIAYFIPSVHHRFTDLLSPVYLIKSAQGGRIERWLTAFDEMAQSPLFGAGLGRYGGQVASDFHLGIYSDGFYMKTLGESGILGLVLLLSIHISLLRDILQKVIRATEGRSKYIAMGGFTGLLAVVFHNSVENVFEFAPMAAMYFNLATLYLIWGHDKGTKVSS